ncbi:hypothetical protein JW813_05175 [Clostridium botulinum]|uniref:hypothetical protein n=1 Tax=Clostridium botulinum TaxID=1491 RepID=UPI0013FB03A5|nr:hypothetical protein [Clostridium botulinum]MBY7023625.1 hypothetical protein [Clostridium botulinum]NFL57815.1 hypothetical protein [Clostridium botulinum]NFL61064.1 hypothetical protein [Clostridium botulinum]NFO46521.1 hypothetical protein [Clostridium botulinum]UZP04400.1 hypothetical protein JW813_05175 [Clostridium botulinum]
MYTVIENLINFKFYENVEEIIRKLTLYNSYKALPDEDYKKLMDLAIEKYGMIKEEVKVEENTEVVSQ